MDCSPPGFSVLGILQARILEWVAMPSSRRSSWPRDWSWVSCTASRFFTNWASSEALSQEGMWACHHKEGWMPKNWWFWTLVLEETLETPLDCKEIKPVNPKGNQPWIFIERTDAEAEAPILWPHDVNSWLTGKKTLMLGKTEGRRRRGDSGQDSWVASLTQCTCIWLTPGDGEGQACCDSLWGCKEPDRIEQLNNNDRDC